MKKKLMLLFASLSAFACLTGCTKNAETNTSNDIVYNIKEYTELTTYFYGGKLDYYYTRTSPMSYYGDDDIRQVINYHSILTLTITATDITIYGKYSYNSYSGEYTKIYSKDGYSYRLVK